MVENKLDKCCYPAASFVDKPYETNVYKQFQLNPILELITESSLPRETRLSLLYLTDIFKVFKT